MKIAFVNQPRGFFSVPPAGSIPIVTYELARRLARSCDVIVYAARGHLQSKVEFDEGIQYRRVLIGRDRRYFRRLYGLLGRFSRFFKRPYASSLYYLDYILQVANDLRAQQCDIVHLHNFSQFAPIIRAFNPSVKIVLHMHCQWLTQIDRATIEQRLRKVDLIIGCSEYITEKIRRRFPQFAGRCQTVFNGVDVNNFVSENGHRTTKKNGTQRLLFVGRVSPEKGVHVLLDAFQILAERYPLAQLDIVGSKEQLPLDFLLSLSDDDTVIDLASFCDRGSRLSYFSHLQKQLDSSGIASHVTFSGQVPYTHVINHYCDADVYVQPSFSEAFPLPILEAMANGLPVVATHVGGIPEAVVNDKTGLLVEPGNAPALAEAILRLLSDKDLRKAMGKAGRQRVLDLFSWEQIAKKMLCQYQKLGEDLNIE
jgi:glycosyltransferase involved in cell wall biosynthesis